MAAIRISGVINEQRQLIVTLPKEIPIGEVALTLEFVEDALPSNANEHRERIKQRMASVGILSTAHHPIEGLTPLPIQERIQLGTLPANARPSEALVAEDRED